MLPELVRAARMLFFRICAIPTKKGLAPFEVIGSRVSQAASDIKALGTYSTWRQHRPMAPPRNVLPGPVRLISRAKQI